MAGLLALCTLAALLLLRGMTGVPDELTTVACHPPATMAGCQLSADVRRQSTCPGETMTQLDPTFRVLSWNIYKGIKGPWQEDLQRLAQECDLLLLQEGYLSPQMHSFLEKNLYHWQMANAFRFRDKVCGVLTASRIKPLSYCAMRQQEPLLRLPKTTMVTSYKIRGSSQTLLAINLHMVNFTLGQKAFKAQLEAVASLMADHQGPVLLAGDLNTWNKKRLAIVRDFCQRYNLQEVDFADDQRSTRFGKVLDHIWYRGLLVSASHSENVASSDHNPCLVTFALADSFQ